MKDQQKINSSEALAIIDILGINMVVDNGKDVTDCFEKCHIEASDKFVVNANYPNNAFLALENDNFMIYLNGIGKFDGFEWSI